MLPIQVLQTTNKLLEALPSKDYQHLLASCESVELIQGEVLCKRNDPIEYIYFPINSIISLTTPLNDGRGMEVAMIGNEGVHGITLMLGAEVAPFHALVQKAGGALRISAPLFMRELERNPQFHTRLKQYLCVVFSQLVQAAICNRFHVVEERLARLLLMIKDRSHSLEFHITQELISQMLGVRRVGVTEAAGWLQQKKLISYVRGNVKIHNVVGLEASSCNCYLTDKRTYNSLLSS